MPWHNHFYKARAAIGQPGRQHVWVGEKKEHFRVTSWNKLKLNTAGGHAVMLSSRCPSGTDSHYLSAKEVLKWESETIMAP